MARLSFPSVHRMLPLHSGIRVLVVLLALCMTLISGPAAAQYRIQPGDRIQVEVLDDPALNRTVLVLPDGSISFPLVGTLQAQGRTVDSLRRDLSGSLAPNFATAPTVTVSVAALAERAEAGEVEGPTIDIYVMGEVQAPGKKEVEPGITILQFLAESGGLTPFAAKSRIELHRVSPTTGTTQVYLFSYNGRGKGPHIPSSTPLGTGDVIVVPSRKLFE